MSSVLVSMMKCQETKTTMVVACQSWYPGRPVIHERPFTHVKLPHSQYPLQKVVPTNSKSNP